MIKQILILPLILMSSYPLLSSPKYGAVNHIFGECALFDGSKSMPLGWISCGEKCADKLDEFCASIGYDYVSRPYPYIESMVLIFILLLSVWLYLKYRLAKPAK